MDPLSITTGCVALISSLSSTSLAISSFIQDYREAAEDFVTLTRELPELRAIALKVQRDCDESSASSIPEEFRPQIAAILKNCDDVVLQIQDLLEQHKAVGRKGATKWTLVDKNSIAKLQVSLQTHRNALGLMLGMISVSPTKAVKDGTAVIREGMVEVRELALNLMEGLQTLRELEDEETGEERLESLDVGGQLGMLERYLDDMTSYAETVIGQDIWEDGEVYSSLMEPESRPSNEDCNQPRQADVEAGPSATTPKPTRSAKKGLKEEEMTENNSRSSGKGHSPPDGTSGKASTEAVGQANAPPATFIHLGGNPPITPVKPKRKTLHHRKKVTLAGDFCGKTTLLRKFVEEEYTADYHYPIGVDYYYRDLDIIDPPLELCITEMGGAEDFATLRRQIHAGTDVFMLCFSLTHSDSLSNIEDVWVPEIREHFPDKPIVLVGLRKDLRDNPNQGIIPQSKEGPVSWAMGEALARKIGAAMYTECSARTGEGVEAVFTEPFKMMFPPKEMVPPKRSWRSRLFS